MAPTVIEEDARESIPYASGISIMDQDADVVLDNYVSPEEAKVLVNETVAVKVLTKKDLEASKINLIAYRFLFWACHRGYLFIVDHILKKYAVSPFLAEKQEKKSPFLVAIEQN